MYYTRCIENIPNLKKHTKKIGKKMHIYYLCN